MTNNGTNAESDRIQNRLQKRHKHQPTKPLMLDEHAKCFVIVYDKFKQVHKISFVQYIVWIRWIWLENVAE